MNLHKEITTLYPELTDQDFIDGLVVCLKDDSDGLGPYILRWEYDKPLPEGLSVGKPTSE